MRNLIILLIIMLSFAKADDSTVINLEINDSEYTSDSIVYEKTDPSEIVKQIIQSKNPRYSEDTLNILANTIVEEANKYENVSYTLLSALITRESNFNTDIKSHKKARGLGQIIRSIAKFSCDSLNIKFFSGIEYNPLINIKITAWFLNWCIKKERGNVDLGLAHYNGGPRNAWRYNCYIKKQNNHKISNIELFGAVRLPEETKLYVSEVNEINKEYEKIATLSQDTVYSETYVNENE